FGATILFSVHCINTKIIATHSAFIGFDKNAKNTAGKKPIKGPTYGTISNKPVIKPITIANSTFKINNKIVVATPTYKDIINLPLINLDKAPSIELAKYSISCLCLLGIALIIFFLK